MISNLAKVYVGHFLSDSAASTEVKGFNLHFMYNIISVCVSLCCNVLTLTRSTGKHQDALKLVLKSAPVNSKSQTVKVTVK